MVASSRARGGETVSVPSMRIVAQIGPTDRAYSVLLEHVADDRTRRKVRQTLERVVRLATEYSALSAAHDGLSTEYDANEAALINERPGLARTSYEQRAQQVDAQLRGLEAQMARLETRLGWGR